MHRHVELFYTQLADAVPSLRVLNQVQRAGRNGQPTDTSALVLSGNQADESEPSTRLPSRVQAETNSTQTSRFSVT